MLFPRHIVTKGSDDGTFEIGGHIIFEDDGSITCEENNIRAATVGMESIPDRDWVQRQKGILRLKLSLVS